MKPSERIKELINPVSDPISNILGINEDPRIQAILDYLDEQYEQTQEDPPQTEE